MTGRDWLVAATSEAFVAHLAALSPRRQRLIATAWVRRVVAYWDGFKRGFGAGLAANEAYADNPADRGGLDRVRKQIRAEQRELDSWHHDEFPYHYTATCRAMALATGADRLDLPGVLGCVRDSISSICSGDPEEPPCLPSARDQEAVLLGLLHDIVDDPFRSVTFDPSWRTDTVLTLTRQMYEAREFSTMPILADALQDAGCEDEAILAHSRDPRQVHVRGCWVVDLVLGKS
jgi:hypothetical protein